MMGCLATLAAGCGADSRNYPGTAQQPTRAHSSMSLAQLAKRPLRLPTLRAHARCPRTAGGHRAPRVGITLGRGPVYPVMGFSVAPPAPRGVVDYRSYRPPTRRGFYRVKVLWVASPRYPGPILVRGGRIDAPGRLSFKPGAPGGRKVKSLRFPSGSSVWRYFATATLIAHPGCYAFQVDGRGVREVIVFKAGSIRQHH